MNKILSFITICAFVFSGVLYKSVDLFYVLIILIGAYAIYREKENLPFELKIFYVFGLLLLFVIVLSILTHDWHLFFEWRFSAFQLLLFIPLIGMFVTFVFDSEECFWKILIISSLYALFWLLLLFFNWPVERDTGYLSVAISRGNMGMLFGLMAMVSFFALPSKVWKSLAVLGFISGVALSIISGSRGGWLALLISMFTLTFIFFRFGKKTEFKYFVVIQLFFTFCLIVFWKELPIQNRLDQVFVDINNYLDGNPYSSVGYRLELWKASYYAFLEKPFLGWGWTNFDIAKQFVVENGDIASIRNFGHPHNQYLLFLVEIGLLGLLSLLAFMLWPFFVAIRFIKQTKEFNSTIYLAILVMVVSESILEFSITDDTFSYKYFIFVFLIVNSYSLIAFSRRRLNSINSKC